MRVTRALRLLLGFVACLTFAGCFVYGARLTPREVSVPAPYGGVTFDLTNALGSSAEGSGERARMLAEPITYHIRYGDLQGQLTAIDINMLGASAPVFSLATGPSPMAGRLAPQSLSPGVGVTYVEALESIRDGDASVLLRTTAHPDGEIGGTVGLLTPDVSAANLGSGASGEASVDLPGTSNDIGRVTTFVAISGDDPPSILYGLRVRDAQPPRSVRLRERLSNTVLFDLPVSDLPIAGVLTEQDLAADAVDFESAMAAMRNGLVDIVVVPLGAAAPKVALLALDTWTADLKLPAADRDGSTSGGATFGNGTADLTFRIDIEPAQGVAAIRVHRGARGADGGVLFDLPARAGDLIDCGQICGRLSEARFTAVGGVTSCLAGLEEIAGGRTYLEVELMDVGGSVLSGRIGPQPLPATGSRSGACRPPESFDAAWYRFEMRVVTNVALLVAFLIIVIAIVIRNRRRRSVRG